MHDSKQTGLGIGQIALIAVLVIILVATCVWGVSAWNASSGVAMGKHGWIALGLGTFFSLLIGCGLMALMFFSAAAATMKPLIRLGASSCQLVRTGPTPTKIRVAETASWSVVTSS